MTMASDSTKENERFGVGCGGGGDGGQWQSLFGIFNLKIFGAFNLESFDAVESEDAGKVAPVARLEASVGPVEDVGTVDDGDDDDGFASEGRMRGG